jgi:predicted transcriptional regulator
MSKTEVYSWRVSPAMKRRLDELARRERRSVASLLEEIVAAHIDAHGADTPGDAAHQRTLHRSAARFAGCMEGSDPQRSATARARVQARLSRDKRAR